jgi:hypothetical protein
VQQSWARSLIWPPPYSEGVSPAQWRVAMKARSLFLLVALSIDVLIVWSLGDHPAIDQDALAFFAACNMSLLAFDLAVSLGLLRWSKWRRAPLLHATIVIEAVTVVVWIQLTGSLTSYFIIVGVVILHWYRFYFGFAAGAVATVALTLFHCGAIALELAGALSPEALFSGTPGGVYAVPMYKVIVIISVAWIYVLAFLGANGWTNKLREKDLALAEVRLEIERVAQGVKHGRLSGTLLCEEYALGEILGRGGMGEIYAARRVSDEATLAVKVLHAHLVDDVSALERFQREAAVAARVPVEHTARVAAVGCDRARGLHFIAMEHLRGEDLGAFLRRQGRLEPRRFLPLLRAIATALDAAHAVGVVHRDLKPQNVFLVHDTGDTGPEGAFAVRLLDFGMSRLADSQSTRLTVARALIGTIGYMAPEQALGDTERIGAAADRFSFAAIAYRVVTGKPPFSAGDLLGAIREVVHFEPPPPSRLRPSLHRDVDAVLALGLAKVVSDRYPSATALVDDLAAALTGSLDEAVRRRAVKLIGTGVSRVETATVSMADVPTDATTLDERADTVAAITVDERPREPQG